MTFGIIAHRLRKLYVIAELVSISIDFAGPSQQGEMSYRIYVLSSYARSSRAKTTSCE